MHDGRQHPSQVTEVETEYIDLGSLSPLSQRELEVFVLLGLTCEHVRLKRYQALAAKPSV